MKKLLLSVTVCLLSIFTGCFMPNSNYVPVKYYDLKLPDNIAPNDISFEVLPFRNSCCPTKQRMIVRSNIQIFIDDYNKWIQSPGVLIQKYLKLAFLSENKKKHSVKYYITGDVVLFESDKENNNSVLSIEYIINDSNHNNVIRMTKTYVTKTNDFTAKGFVNAMSENASKLAQSIKKDLISLR